MSAQADFSSLAREFAAAQENCQSKSRCRSRSGSSRQRFPVPDNKLEAMSTRKGDWMPELSDEPDRPIRSEKDSNVCPAGIDIAYHRPWEGDSHTYDYTRHTSIFQ